MQSNIDLHTAVEISSGLIGLAGFIIMLMIRSTQAAVKDELKDQMSETSKDVAVHAASDDAKFEAISRTLIRIDHKIDRQDERERSKI